jgi:hypothetical protein
MFCEGSMYTLKNTSHGDACTRQSWALYRLQSLPTTKLIRVVNRILKGDDILVNPLGNIEKEQIEML